MIINILYCTFFGILDFIIYSSLSKIMRFDKRIIVLFSILTVFLFLFHFDFFRVILMMSQKKFNDLLWFSFGLGTIHFFITIKIKSIDKSVRTKTDKDKKTLLVLKILSSPVVYIGLFLFQVLIILNNF